MSEVSYRYRAHPFARALTYRLGENDLLINDGAREWSVPYADFTFVEAFDVRFLGSQKPYWCHILRTHDRRSVVVGAGFRDRWSVADRETEYQTFIGKLMG